MIFYRNWILFYRKTTLCRGGPKFLLSKKSSENFNIEKVICNFYFRKRHHKFLLSKKTSKRKSRETNFFDRKKNEQSKSLLKKIVLGADIFLKKKSVRWGLKVFLLKKKNRSLWDHRSLGPDISSIEKTNCPIEAWLFSIEKKPTVLWGSIFPEGLKFF